MRFPFHNANNGLLDYCHISGEKNLIEVIDLGDQPLSDTLIEHSELKKKEKFFPLKIMRSPTLGHTQLSHVVPQNELYHLDYPYRPGITKEIVEHHSEQAKFNIEKYKIDKGSLVVDIGSNDGTLLNEYKKLGLKVCGVEPTNMARVAESENGVLTIQKSFDENVSNEIIKKMGKAKIVVMTNVFAHMSSLGSVMEGIDLLLDTDGILIIENHYMMDIIKYNQYDTFYHEHIRNYSLKSIQYLYKMYNFNIIDANVVQRYNGSIKVVATKSKSLKSFIDIETLIKNEKQYGMFNDDIWNDFSYKIKKSKLDLLNTLKGLKREGYSIVGNSCPARCSTLINYCDIGIDLLPYIAEQPTSHKLNKYLPGKKIPIINNDILYEEQPDYILLLAWHLAEPIMQQLKDRGIKSKFIIPLPEVKIL